MKDVILSVWVFSFCYFVVLLEKWSLRVKRLWPLGGWENP